MGPQGKEDPSSDDRSDVFPRDRRASDGPRASAATSFGRTPARDAERRALLAAAEAAIAEKGFARTTVDDVAARAKLGTDVFYTHFQGMGALLRALSEQFAEQMIGVTDQSTRTGIWKGAAARDVVEVAVRSILDVVIERGGLVRAFLAHGATDPALAADLRRIGTHMAQRIIATLAECTDVPARPSRAIAFSLLTAVALAHHYILVGDEWSGVSFTKEQLTEEASRAICAYLGLQPTIAIKQETPDAAPTGMIEAIGTGEVEIVRTTEGEPSRER
jgi:AcrR family transcriptional regulator